VIRTYGGGGDGDGGDDVDGVERDVGDDTIGKEDEEDEDEDEDEDVVVSQDASEITEGRIRNGIGRRERTKSCFGDVLDMMQGIEASMRLGSRELTTGCCGDQGGGGEFGCWRGAKGRRVTVWRFMVGSGGRRVHTGQGRGGEWGKRED
jgi:hypothetical protein